MSISDLLLIIVNNINLEAVITVEISITHQRHFK
jgi:hypothetical protein